MGESEMRLLPDPPAHLPGPLLHDGLRAGWGRRLAAAGPGDRLQPRPERIDHWPCWDVCPVCRCHMKLYVVRREERPDGSSALVAVCEGCHNLITNAPSGLVSLGPATAQDLTAMPRSRRRLRAQAGQVRASGHSR